MKLYLAANAFQLLNVLATFEDIGVLLTYYDLRAMPEAELAAIYEAAETRRFSLFLDSGAYGAWTRGETIAVADYIAFCREHGRRFEKIAALDVIGDWQASARNYEAMAEAGLRFIPAFHYMSPWEALRRLACEYDYIGLGGLAPLMRYSRKRAAAWLSLAFREVRDTAVKVHGFATTGWWIVKRFPFDSVDSTSWAINPAYRRIPIHEPGSVTAVRPNPRNYHALISRLQHSSTPPEDVFALFVGRPATREKVIPLLRHSARCYLNAAAELRAARRS